MKPISLYMNDKLIHDRASVIKHLAFHKSEIGKYDGRFDTIEQKIINRLTDELADINTRLAPVLEKLASAIETAEGRATERTITTEIILDDLAEVENHLGIAKSRMNGIIVHIDSNAQKFPSAYKYIPMSTHLTAHHNGKGWIIDEIRRSRCGTTKSDIHLTDDAKAAILDRMSVIR